MAAHSQIRERMKQTDVLALIEGDLGPAKKSGRWYKFSCPLPGHKNGDKHPSLLVYPDRTRWYCNGCQNGGDALNWLQKAHGMSFKQALEMLNTGNSQHVNPIPKTVEVLELAEPPGDSWKAAGLALVEQAERALWSEHGRAALSWLRAERGLHDETIKRWRLGYLPVKQIHRAENWGIFDSEDGKFYIHAGLLIPCFAAGELWYMKIRQGKDAKQKYVHIRGGRPALFGADNLTGADDVLLVEGEFDAMLAAQEIGDVVGVATLGSAGKQLDIATWGGYFAGAKAILLAYDSDEAGKKGAENLSRLSKIVYKANVPKIREGDKDITDYWKAGGNLWHWIAPILQSYDPIPEDWNILAAQLGAVITPLEDEKRVLAER